MRLANQWCPTGAFAEALSAFITETGEKAFQNVLRQTKTVEQARFLFIWTPYEYRKRVVPVWKKLAKENAIKLCEDRGVSWQTLRRHYSMAPSGSDAERILSDLWHSHPGTREFLSRPQVTVCGIVTFA